MIDLIFLKALYYAGVFLLHVERVDKAREYVDRLLKINPQSKDGLILKGWLEVSNLLRFQGPTNWAKCFFAIADATISTTTICLGSEHSWGEITMQLVSSLTGFAFYQTVKYAVICIW